MNWNAQLYDGKHRFVSEFGQDVIKLLAPVAGEKILDVGCGTGDLAASLFSQGVQAAGVDQSPSMIQEAKQKYPDVSFLVRDAHDLQYEEEFDAVFSNAAIHWMKQPGRVLTSIWKSLKPGGRLVAEFGGKGNVRAISRTIIHQIDDYDSKMFPWFFPSVGEYTCMMEQAGFRTAFAEHFHRPTRLEGADGMHNWITMFGDVVMGAQTPEEKKRIITGAVNELKEEYFFTDYWIADYWRIRVVGIKE
ncbi:class I SAM-dependent methyltransferase [Domibacillus indicus]|uniref:class I SAM-dependent methyltransferase n=1 Tax=Domibacillus indicus TaxID=1437523 RepID=UPI000617DC94|nr:class I SAM-dependent methyltransferase [Domibacillus indicus]